MIGSLRTIDEDVRIIVIDDMRDEDAITVRYPDVGPVGASNVDSKRDLPTHTGVVSFGSASYRFGQPVVVRLVDPDLNLNSDVIDIYHTVDDPASPFVDTVGTPDGGWLLEILIKGARYARCVIDGVEYGGLASTGFSLVETGSRTGVFEGVFKMPSTICNKEGTRIISPAGGSIDARYNDFLDGSGGQGIFKTGRTHTPPAFSEPLLNGKRFVVPDAGRVEVIAYGSVDGDLYGIPLRSVVTAPSGTLYNLGTHPADSGEYKIIYGILPDAETGRYAMRILYRDIEVGRLVFDVVYDLMSQVRSDAGRWAGGLISEEIFADGLRRLITDGEERIRVDGTRPDIPDWVEEPARWWADGRISDDEFLRMARFLIGTGIIRV